VFPDLILFVEYPTARDKGIAQRASPENARPTLSHPCASALNRREERNTIAVTANVAGLIKGAIMKFSPMVPVKSLILASALAFGVGMAQAQGYDQGGSMQQPGGSTQPGTSGGGSDYGTSSTGGSSQPSRYDNRPDKSKPGDSYQGSRTYQDMELYDSDGSGGTGPKLKGRY
jgi:hypothetical protein